jgi:hypothetical protein
MRTFEKWGTSASTKPAAGRYQCQERRELHGTLPAEHVGRIGHDHQVENAGCVDGTRGQGDEPQGTLVMATARLCHVAARTRANDALGAETD